jgi:hypothetical protein
MPGDPQILADKTLAAGELTEDALAEWIGSNLRSPTAPP